MSSRVSLRYWGSAAALLLLAACNRPDLVDPTATPSPRPLSLEEIETWVVETLEAEGTMTAAARPSDTPTPTDEPTATPSDTPEGPTETPTEVPSCLVVANALNLRSGPGLPYDPPLQTLSSGTVLLPFAKNGDGSWLEVQLQGEATTGWVSSEGQFVSCNFDPSGLPLGQIPPTPTPTNTLTPTPTLTPSPTDKPTSTPTACPKFTNPFIRASASAGSTTVSLTWGSQGGCGAITGTITATVKGDDSPYQTYSIKGGSGSLTDKSPTRGCSWTVIYVLTLKDSSGQTLTTSTSASLSIVC
jgi:hypothetical protein